MHGAAGELAIQCSPEQLQPFAAPIVERLVPILAAPMAQMPRSIVENRYCCLHDVFADMINKIADVLVLVLSTVACSDMIVPDDVILKLADLLFWPSPL